MAKQNFLNNGTKLYNFATVIKTKTGFVINAGIQGDGGRLGSFKTYSEVTKYATKQALRLVGYKPSN